MSFREFIDPDLNNTRDAIVGTLKDVMSINDEEILLSMNTSDMSHRAIEAITSLGIVRDNDDLKSKIKDGIYIKDLINAIDNSIMPKVRQ